MDTVSHALWGYAITRWRGPKTARWGALAGAAPDLLYNGGALVGHVATKGFRDLGSLSGGSDGDIWSKDGPPLPQTLVDIYNHYYVWTHSLVVLAATAGILYLIRRKPPWLLLPYLLHILMDMPTHERYQTPFLFPLSRFTFQGMSWSRPPILVANFSALVVAYSLLWWVFWRKNRVVRRDPWPEQIEGVV